MAISPISNVPYSRTVSFGNNNSNGTSIIKALPVALLLTTTGCNPYYETPEDVFNRTVGDTEVPVEPSRKAADKNQPPSLTAMKVVSSGDKTLYINGYSKKGEIAGVHSVELHFVKKRPDGTKKEMYGKLTGFCLEPVDGNYMATIKLQNQITGEDQRAIIAFSNPFGSKILELLGNEKNRKSTIAMYPRVSEFNYYNGNNSADPYDKTTLTACKF